MTSRDFARKWLEQRGMFDEDSDYDGAIGDAVMEVWNVIANQGHTGMSAAMLFAAIDGIHKDYENPDSPIWTEYWASPEGQALKASFKGA